MCAFCSPIPHSTRLCRNEEKAMRSKAKPEADPELGFGGHLIHFIVFLCERFLNTMVCYTKYFILGEGMAQILQSRMQVLVV